MVGGWLWHVKTDADGSRSLLVKGRGGEAHDWCCVRVVPGEEPMKRGDKVWWQGRSVFWTAWPEGKPVEEPIERMGYSFSIPEDMRRLMNERVEVTEQ